MSTIFVGRVRDEIGGIPETVKHETLHEVFIPFG